MDKIQAEKIINKYGEAVAQGGIARKISLLPCNKSIIKYAFFVYIEDGIKDGVMTEEMLKSLWGTYNCLDHFIEDKEADFFNKIVELIKNKQINLNSEENKETKSFYKYFLYNKITNNSNLEEICEFIDVMKQKYSY